MYKRQILLGLVLGPMVEENFRRALLLSRGDMTIFLQRPISATFVGISTLLLIGVTWSAWRGKQRAKLLPPIVPESAAQS